MVVLVVRALMAQASSVFAVLDIEGTNVKHQLIPADPTHVCMVVCASA